MAHPFTLICLPPSIIYSRKLNPFHIVVSFCLSVPPFTPDPSVLYSQRKRYLRSCGAKMSPICPVQPLPPSFRETYCSIYPCPSLQLLSPLWFGLHTQSFEEGSQISLCTESEGNKLPQVSLLKHVSIYLVCFSEYAGRCFQTVVSKLWSPPQEEGLPPQPRLLKNRHSPLCFNQNSSFFFRLRIHWC